MTAARAAALPSGLLVGSGSAAKVAAVRAAAADLLPGCPVEPAGVESGVAGQPAGMAAVRQGAVGRALAAAAMRSGAWGVGIENGIVRRGGQVYAAGWCAVSDGRRVLGAASSPEYALPPALAAAVGRALAEGATQAEATARLFGGTAQDWAERGTVAALTGGRLERAELWRVPVLLALGAALHAAAEPPSPRRTRGPGAG